MQRTNSIDLLRGFIMLLMALDHARGMIARTSFTETWGLNFAAYPDILNWFTRAITHLCAPGFFLLMGMSMVLFAQKRFDKGWQLPQIRWYFFKRGLLIILLMFFVEMPAWMTNNFFSVKASATDVPPFPGQMPESLFVPSTVLYGLGMSMIIGAWLWRFSKPLLLAISVLCFAFSTWWIGQLSPDDVLHPIWVALFTPGVSWAFMALYPIVPWLGVTTFGMFWAKLLEEKKEQVYRLFLYVGAAFVLTFLLVRFAEWGNFHKNDFHDFISFFTLVKYPPSIPFILITCGINLILLFVFSKLEEKSFLQPIQLFGQTAMFFYLIHLHLYAWMGALFPEGATIGVMYGMWLLGLVLLYFPCKWYLDFKRRKPSNSIWRMI